MPIKCRSFFLSMPKRNDFFNAGEILDKKKNLRTFIRIKFAHICYFINLVKVSLIKHRRQNSKENPMLLFVLWTDIDFQNKSTILGCLLAIQMVRGNKDKRKRKRERERERESRNLTRRRKKKISMDSFARIFFPHQIVLPTFTRRKKERR
jgi:hypothetical protein